MILKRTSIALELGYEGKEKFYIYSSIPNGIPTEKNINNILTRIFNNLPIVYKLDYSENKAFNDVPEKNPICIATE